MSAYDQFGYSLDAQTTRDRIARSLKDLQWVHDMEHIGGNEAEVLTTAQHLITTLSERYLLPIESEESVTLGDGTVVPPEEIACGQAWGQYYHPGMNSKEVAAFKAGFAAAYRPPQPIAEKVNSLIKGTPA